MKVRIAAAVEQDAYLGIDAGAAVSLKISGCMKRELVGSGRCIRFEIAATPVRIRGACCHCDPLCGLKLFKQDGNPSCRLSQHRIQHVR